MYTAGRCEAHEVHGLAGAGAVFESALHLGVFEDGAVGDSAVDFHQILVYDAACADIEVTDLGVAHLAVGKADKLAACLEMGVGICFEKIVPVGSGSAVDGVGMIVLAFAPAIENDK